jgi:hypothetical protein
MPKNITLAVPDELAMLMEDFKEVNWSAVARDAIEAYVRRRSQPNVAPLLERLAKEREGIYAEGWVKAEEVVKDMSYRDLYRMFRDISSSAESLGYNMITWSSYSPALADIAEIRNEPPAYLEGFRDALRELKEKLEE